jgi:hypothetical protein
MINLKDRKDLISYQLIINRRLMKDFKSKCADDDVLMSIKLREMISKYVGE